MGERSDPIQYVGEYRTSRRVKDLLSRFGAEVSVPAVDWDNFMLMETSGFELDTEKDNRSVWNIWWSLRGLAAFGGSSTAAPEIPAELSARFPDATPAIPGASSGSMEGPVRTGRQFVGSATNGGRARSSTASAGVLTTPNQRDRHNADRVGGSFPSGWDQLPPDQDVDSRRRDGEYDDSAWRSAISATLGILKPAERNRPILTLAEVANEHIHLSHFSGAPHFRRNGDVLESELERASQLGLGLVGFHPYTAGKRVQHGLDAPKGRLVWMAPLSTTLQGSRYAKAALYGIRKCRSFSYGRYKAEVGTIVSELSSRYERVVCLDFSRFDSSLSASLIDTAFQILRRFMAIEDPEDDAMFDRLTNDFIHSRIVLPDRSIWQTHRGVPSGNPFTSLVDSVCNMLILQYVHFRITGHGLKERQVMILGDDSVFGTNAKIPVSLIAGFARELGVVVSVEKSVVATRTDGVEFLGHRWVNSRPHRDPLDLAKRIAFTERHAPRDRRKSLLRIVSYLADAEEAVDLVLPLVMRRGTTSVLDTLESIMREVSNGDRDLFSDGPGRLRFMAAVERENLPPELFSSALAPWLGLKY